MRGRRNDKLELPLVDLRDLQKRIRKIRKTKAGIYKRWGITNFDERKWTNKLKEVPIAVGFDLKQIVFYGELPIVKKWSGRGDLNSRLLGPEPVYKVNPNLL